MATPSIEHTPRQIGRGNFTPHRTKGVSSPCWIDAGEFAIAALRPVQRAAHRLGFDTSSSPGRIQRGGSLRLPSRDETVADIRIRGRKIPRKSGGLAIRNTGWNVRSCSYVGLPSCGTSASESLSPAMASHSLRSRNAAEHQRALIQMTGPECQYMFVNGPECRRKSP